LAAIFGFSSVNLLTV